MSQENHPQVYDVVSDEEIIDISSDEEEDEIDHIYREIFHSQDSDDSNASDASTQVHPPSSPTDKDLQELMDSIYFKYVVDIQDISSEPTSSVSDINPQPMTLPTSSSSSSAASDINPHPMTVASPVQQHQQQYQPTNQETIVNPQPMTVASLNQEPTVRYPPSYYQQQYQPMSGPSLNLMNHQPTLRPLPWYYHQQDQHQYQHNAREQISHLKEMNQVLFGMLMKNQEVINNLI